MCSGRTLMGTPLSCTRRWTTARRCSGGHRIRRRVRREFRRGRPQPTMQHAVCWGVCMQTNLVCLAGRVHSAGTKSSGPGSRAIHWEKSTSRSGAAALSACGARPKGAAERACAAVARGEHNRHRSRRSAPSPRGVMAAPVSVERFRNQREQAMRVGLLRVEAVAAIVLKEEAGRVRSARRMSWDGRTGLFVSTAMGSAGCAVRMVSSASTAPG